MKLEQVQTDASVRSINSDALESSKKMGYDIGSGLPGSGKLRFIEVTGRVSGALTITATRKEILHSLNTPINFILAIVEFPGEDTRIAHYLRAPFQREPNFGVTSVNHDFAGLLCAG